MALALTAVRQLQTRLSGGQPGRDRADPSRLSHAVSHAIKAAMRLRKAIVDAADLDCSDCMAAMLADALDAAATLVESSGGLTSATGPPTTLQTLWHLPGCVVHVNFPLAVMPNVLRADGVTSMQHERGHQAASLMITAAELRARPWFATHGGTDCRAGPVCDLDHFRWLLEADRGAKCVSRAACACCRLAWAHTQHAHAASIVTQQAHAAWLSAAFQST